MGREAGRRRESGGRGWGEDGRGCRSPSPGAKGGSAPCSPRPSGPGCAWLSVPRLRRAFASAAGPRRREGCSRKGASHDGKKREGTAHQRDWPTAAGRSPQAGPAGPGLAGHAVRLGRAGAGAPERVGPASRRHGRRHQADLTGTQPPFQHQPSGAVRNRVGHDQQPARTRGRPAWQPMTRPGRTS